MLRLIFLVCVLICVPALAAGEQWKPADSTLYTRWANDVDPAAPLPEYPRPQLIRKGWTNLNGLWDYAIRPTGDERPSEFDGKILVPFAVESALSGVKKRVGGENRLWYRRTFSAPELTDGARLLLHFGGVDWHAIVHVNGKQVGEHCGGYDAFTLDVTDALEPEGPQELVVSVWDPTDAGKQPRGKQVNNPRGIWYTPVTGIWQTVWLEVVPKTYISSLTITPVIDNEVAEVTVQVADSAEQTKAWAKAFDGDTLVAEAAGDSGEPMRLKIEEAKLWSPDSPFLYDLKVGLGDPPTDGDDETASPDSVQSYFGMRKIEMKPDDAGVNRIWLNGQVIFQIGPLDQGWWPDGLYTAATDKALRYDVEMTRRLGFNMARKHVKVEPRRWYYHCDKLGLLVWQDMPNGAKGDTFEQEWKNVIDMLRNHPSIVMWVPFNEGWGQYDTERIARWTKEYDPTRLVNEASGWHHHGSGDVFDIHKYPGPAMPELKDDRAAVLGEFGGLGLPVKGHLWWDKKNWGYRKFDDPESLQAGYDDLIRQLRPMIGRGLTAAVYTQTSDVEGEVNGLMTYERQVVKFDIEKMAEQHESLHLPPH